MENEDWMTEPKDRMVPFLSLKGDKGEEILIFRGPPEQCDSNFKDKDGVAKKEWRFPAYRGILDDKNGRIDWDPVLITESGDNFRGHLTAHVKGMGWGKSVVVKWVKRQGKHQAYKDFTIVPIHAPNMPPEE